MAESVVKVHDHNSATNDNNWTTDDLSKDDWSSLPSGESCPTHKLILEIVVWVPCAKPGQDKAFMVTDIV